MAEDKDHVEEKKWLDHFKSRKNQTARDSKIAKDTEELSEGVDNGQDNPVSIEAKLARENAELRDKFIRTLAELDNTRKRFYEEKDRISKYAIAGFVKDLINVMENFYLAMGSISEKEKNGSLEVFYGGVELTFSELRKAFEKNNVRRIYPLEEQFNPDCHEAITSVESNSTAGTIVEVMQAGYTLNGRVIKPALVVVAK
jgi:molecular chaperone GrpE